MFIRVKAEFGADKAASGLEVVVPMPREVQRVSCSYDREPKPAGSQSWDWQERSRRLVWKFKRVPGGSDHTLQVLQLFAKPIMGSFCTLPTSVKRWSGTASGRLDDHMLNVSTKLAGLAWTCLYAIHIGHHPCLMHVNHFD